MALTADCSTHTNHAYQQSQPNPLTRPNYSLRQPIHYIFTNDIEKSRYTTTKHHYPEHPNTISITHKYNLNTKQINHQKPIINQIIDQPNHNTTNTLDPI